MIHGLAWRSCCSSLSHLQSLQCWASQHVQPLLAVVPSVPSHCRQSRRPLSTRNVQPLLAVVPSVPSHCRQSRRPLSTRNCLQFRYETMAQPAHRRVLVKMKKGSLFEDAHFTKVHQIYIFHHQC